MAEMRTRGASTSAAFGQDTFGQDGWRFRAGTDRADAHRPKVV
jgi:hypothetical protein